MTFAVIFPIRPIQCMPGTGLHVQAAICMLSLHQVHTISMKYTSAGTNTEKGEN